MAVFDFLACQNYAKCTSLMLYNSMPVAHLSYQSKGSPFTSFAFSSTQKWSIYLIIPLCGHRGHGNLNNICLKLVTISPFRSTNAALFLLAIPYMYNKIGFSVFVGCYKQGAKYAAFRVLSRVYLIVIKLNRRGIEKNKDMKMPVRPVDVCVLPDRIRFHPRVPVTLTVAAF